MSYYSEKILVSMNSLLHVISSTSEVGFRPYQSRAQILEDHLYNICGHPIAWAVSFRISSVSTALDASAYGRLLFALSITCQDPILSIPGRLHIQTCFAAVFSFAICILMSPHVNICCALAGRMYMISVQFQITWDEAYHLTSWDGVRSGLISRHPAFKVSM